MRFARGRNTAVLQMLTIRVSSSVGPVGVARDIAARARQTLVASGPVLLPLETLGQGRCCPSGQSAQFPVSSAQNCRVFNGQHGGSLPRVETPDWQAEAGAACKMPAYSCPAVHRAEGCHLAVQGRDSILVAVYKPRPGVVIGLSGMAATMVQAGVPRRTVVESWGLGSGYGAESLCLRPYGQQIQAIRIRKNLNKNQRSGPQFAEEGLKEGLDFLGAAIAGEIPFGLTLVGS